MPESPNVTGRFIAAIMMMLGAAACLGAEPIKPAADAPQPHTPAQSAAFFKTPAGFRVELVASEPMLADPTAIAFDARGRIFVCELHGYNLDGHYDVQALNKTGVLDKTVRRIPASREAQQRAEKDTYGTVKMLEDTDGDGVVDRMTVWADRLPPCYGVVPARGGVIVTCAPDIVYLADRDGDGKPDVRRTLFTGFGRGELWTRINNPRWGPDNWIYIATGHGGGGDITGPNLTKGVHLGNSDFRIQPDGSAIEPVTGGSGGFGQAISDFGDRFLINNSNHARYAIPLPYRYLARNPYVAAPGGIADAAHYTNIFPTSQPHPWRLARSQQAAWRRFYGEHEATAHGYFTAACGPAIYRADAFGPQYRGNHFSCEAQQNMVHRCIVERDGAAFNVHRAADEPASEFLTSTEGWFRPVNLTTGPDGALYIVDMYRQIIEDYSAIPRYLQQQYGLIEGNDRGRIWRVVAKGAAKAPRPDLAGATDVALVQQLANPNAWWRQTAQRLLIERGAGDVADAVRAVLRDGPTPESRLHALYTLAGLRLLSEPDVSAALNDAHEGVRVHGLRLCERWLDRPGPTLDKALAMIDDPAAIVRLQLAMTLGQTHDRRAIDALAQLALRHGDEAWMRNAVLSSVAETSGQLLAALLHAGGGAGGGVKPNGDNAKTIGDYVAALASVIGAHHDDTATAQLLTTLADVKGEHAAAWQARGLDALFDSLKRAKSAKLKSAAGRDALMRLLANRDADVRTAALKLVGSLKLADAPAMQQVYEQAQQDALSTSRSIEQRVAAVNLLASAPFERIEPVARKLMDPRQPLDLQLASVAALAAGDDSRAGGALLAGWVTYSPRVQQAVLDALFSRTNRLDALLDAVERRTVGATALHGLHRLRLVENADPRIRQRARALLATRPDDTGREQVLKRYLAAVQSSQRDAKHGSVVFNNLCAKCHALKGQGRHVGPDLSSANSRADETLLNDVLQPSAQITPGYRSYLVESVDGQTLAGPIAAESATSITVRQELDNDKTVLRKDIVRMAALELSMMPDNIDKTLSPQDVADVIAYLRQVLGPTLPSKVTLFDDDAKFAALLAEGGGKVAVSTDEHFAGTASLTVTPLQRYSAAIPGWSYRITERPAPGEYRYLRLAWKTRGGQGVMIELAAQGRWPAASDPARRYYSGRNTTEWQARQVATAAPNDWTIVTVDLWKDCGTFTLTGIAPTAMGGVAMFDRIELLRSLEEVAPDR